MIATVYKTLNILHEDAHDYQSPRQSFCFAGKTKRGEDIGIISGDQIVALQPVSVTSDDYAWREYGATAAERKRGKIKRVSGNQEKDMADISKP